MDEQADGCGLSPSQWQERYNIESHIEEIYKFEEIPWQRRVEGGGKMDTQRRL
jgi:hypothetical protein